MKPNDVFLLLVLFQLKHFLADYPLQGRYMLGKFSRDPNVWIPALIAHALVHYVFTLAIVWWFADLPTALLLAFVDYAVHFVVDRIKASPDLLGRWKPDTPYFWWALGWDQAMHHLTHYLIIFTLVNTI